VPDRVIGSEETNQPMSSEDNQKVRIE